MQTIQDQNAEGIAIAMDDKFFLRCHYTNCVLIFGGGECEWLESSFTNCRIATIGPAKRFIKLLQSFGFAKDLKGDESPTEGPTGQTVQ